VDLYDFGVASNGDYYYVMELLDGLDLQSLVNRYGAVAAERTVHLLIQACDSLADAHFRGMVHRDIKPANIFTCRMGPTVDFVKVLDFGLVKSFAEPAERGADLTDDDVVSGTPAFMAPEQLEGGESTPATDLYALGCVAYWLLTGTHVFDGATPIKVALEHLRAIPDPPSVRSELDIPEALEGIVLDCLEKDPAQRPVSAEELARTLGAVALPTHWDQDRARAWWDLHMTPRGSQGS
jgi:serine/threonine-protein kinase